MLSKKKLKAIDLFNQGFPIKRIAEEIKTSERTIYRWKKEDDFIQELDEKQQEIREEIRRKFLYTAYKAHETLNKTMMDRNAIARVQAAKEILLQAGFTPDNAVDVTLKDQIVIVDDITRTDEYED